MQIKSILTEDECKYNKTLGNSEFKKITFRPEEADGESVYFHLKSTYSEKTAKLIAENRPVCVISDRKLDTDGIPVILTENPRKMLSYAYARFCDADLSRIKFVGITGTNGKTTTASMIKAILSAEEKRVGFIGTGKIESDGRILSGFDYSMTTPDPDVLYPAIKRMAEDGCEYIIMEVSSHSLAYEKLAPITFEVSVFTNLSHEHLDFHGNIEDYFKTKCKLFEKSKLGIFNIDDEYGRRAFSEAKCDKKSVGILWEANINAKGPKLFGFMGSAYLYRGENFIFKMNLPLAGAYNIYNSLCAISTACALGCRPCMAKKALEQMRSPDGRFETINGSVTVIIDYAHTPLAFENVLKTIKSCKNSEQKLICVFGCGGLRDKEKRPLMAKTAESLCDFLVITEDNSRGEEREKIIDDILKGVSDLSKCAVIPARKEAIENAILDAEDGSVIAILGKGAERYNIDKNGTHPFDEREIAKRALEKRKECIF